MVDQSDARFSSRVSRNLVTNVLRTLIMALAGLLMVPYYIDQFGLATYALLPLATTITNYFIMVSDALSRSFSRYMTMSIRGGDVERSNAVYSTSVIGMCGLVMVMVPIALMVSFIAPYIFNIGGSDALDVQVMFLLIMVASMVISLGASFGGVYMASNHLYITYLCRILQTLSQVGVVIVLLLMQGPDLKMIGVSFLVSALLMLAGMLMFIRRICPTLRFSRKSNDRALLKEMCNLGMWTTISDIGTLLYIQGTVIVVNMILGSEAQGSFSIAANVIMMVHTACAAIAAVALPLAYREFTKGDEGRLVEVLKLFAKFIGMTMAFPLAYAMVFMPEILTTWLGEGYDDVCTMLYVMLPLEVLICTTSAYSDVPVIYARARPMAMAVLGLGVFNVVSAVMVLEFTDLGVLGACACWSLSLLLQKLLFFPIYSHRLTGGGLRAFYSPIAVSYAVFAVLLVAMYASSLVLPITAGWLNILLPLFLSFAVFVPVMLRFLFSREERTLIRTYLPGPLQRLIRV